MNPSELKIGNYFLPTRNVNGILMPMGVAAKVLTINFEGVEWVRHDQIPAQVETWNKCKYSEMEPVTITDEWLQKLGFKDISDANYNQWTKETPGKPIIELIRRYHQDNLKAYSYKQLGIEVNYVHQLQNIYFALSGQELKLV